MTGAATRGDLWIRPIRQVPGAALRLFCFPHAGGAVSYFRPLFTRLPGGVDVVGVQYPGRQDRAAEPQVRSIQELADDVAAALSPAWTGTPFAFFGHSMGSIVAFEVAVRLRASGVAPSILFASGHRAPSLRRDATAPRWDDSRLLAEVSELSGTEPELLADPDILDMVLPPLRADYHAIRTYRPAPGTPRLDVPITALVGDSDPRVSVDDVDAWRDHTTGRFARHVCAGGDHFYLARHPDWTRARITEGLAL